MILKKHHMLILSSLLLFNASSFAAMKKLPAFSDNSNIPPQNFAAPAPFELGLYNDQDIEKLSTNFIAESKRRPAGTNLVGTEDMLSKEYIQFRN